MLVLTRRLSQTIEIGDDIKITIVEIRDGAVRVGIDAPKEVAISRPDAINKEQKGSRQ